MGQVVDMSSASWAIAGEFEGLATAPHGTVTSFYDLGAGVLKFFCEPEPHPEDWAGAVEFMAKFGTSEPAVESWDGGVLVFTKKVRAGIAESLPDHDASCPADCLHLNPYRHGPFCPPLCRHLEVA